MENSVEKLMDVVDKLIQKYEIAEDDIIALEEAIYALDVSSSYDEEADEEADEEENYSDFE